MRMHLLPLLAAVLIAPAAHAITADELVPKNLQARGGLDKLKALQTLRFSGKVDAGNGVTYDYVLLQKRPDFAREEESLQGLTEMEASDGTEAWKIEPWSGRKDPERMAPEDARWLTDDAAIEGPLGAAHSGGRLEYLGTEDIDGTAAHKLKLTLANGDLYEIYLDPEYFLEIRRVRHLFVRGVERQMRIDYGDYEQVNGVYFPLSISMQPKGSPDKQVITIEKVEANAPVDDGLFHFPAAKH